MVEASSRDRKSRTTSLGAAGRSIMGGKKVRTMFPEEKEEILAEATSQRDIHLLFQCSGSKENF